MNYIEWFKKIRESFNGKVLVQNVPSKDLDDRSFIEYWEKHVNYSFSISPYLCPATMQLCKREDLDGAHVKIVGSSDDRIYITAVHKSFNRSRNSFPFYVKRRFLVLAPKQK